MIWRSVPDGTFVWTAIEDGILYAQSPGQPVRKLWEGQRGLNAISFTRDGKRLFVTLVFYGDALYEIDLAGVKPPRLVVDKPGGLNGFQIGDDGMIYGPLVFGKRVVKINPDTGEMTTVSDEFEDPGALKLDFKGSAYVLNNDTELRKLDLATGKSVVFANLPAGADNLDIDSKGNIFVSLSEVNAIVEIDAGDRGDSLCRRARTADVGNGTGGLHGGWQGYGLPRRPVGRDSRDRRRCRNHAEA